MATLAELDALVDANPDAARGIAAVYEVLLGGVPSIDGFVFLINNAKATNFGSNNPNVTFNQENIFINLANALVQGNPAAKAGFDAIVAGEATLADKLRAIYDAFVPHHARSEEGRAFFARPEAQAFYQQVAAERGVAGPDGAAIVGLASLLKILVADDIGLGDDVNDLMYAVDYGIAQLPNSGTLTPVETADGGAFDNDEDYIGALLTDGVDTVTGTQDEDFIQGQVVATPLLPIQTLNSGDSIDGGGGRDTIQAQLVDMLVQPLALTDVEVLNLEASPTALGLAAGPRVVDAINANAIDEIGFRSPNANIISGLQLRNVASDVTEVNINDSFGLPLGPLANVGHVVTFIGATARDTVDVNLNNVVNSSLLLLGGGYETVNLDSFGPVANVFSLGVAEAETLTITGSTDLNLTAWLPDLADSALVVGMPGSFEIDPLALVDAAAFSGSLVISLGNEVDAGLDGVNDQIEVRGGSGDDEFGFRGTLDSDVTASGGAGDDEFSFAALGDGRISFTAADTVDGGAGTDVLEIFFRDGPGLTTALLGAGVGTNIVGIERIRHDASGMPDNLTVDWTRKGSATELQLAGNYSFSFVTVTGLANEDTVIYSGTTLGGLSLTSLNGAGSLSNEISLRIETIDALDSKFINALAVDAETELLNIEVTGGGIGYVVDAGAVESDVTITGADRLTFGITVAYDLAGGTVDGSAATGNLHLYVATGKQSVSGGSGDDFIVLRDSIVADLVVLGAGGADTVSVLNPFIAATTLANVHHVAGFSIADDIIQIDDNVGFVPFVDTAGNNNVEPLVGRDVVAGEVADLSASAFGFLKFTAAVATTAASTADSMLDTALGAGQITTGTLLGEGVLGLAYDSTNGQIVIFEIIDTAGAGLLTVADTAEAVATVSMSYADFLAFGGANLDFTSVV